MFPHPAARILLWCLAAVLLQRLSPSGLLVATVLLAAALERAGLAEFLRLLRRARWLLVALVAVYALLPAAGSGAADPAQSAIAAGLMQAARLVLTLALVALLLATTPVQALVAGVHRICLPLRRLGLDPDRLAVRIGLTLHYCAGVRPGRDWRQWGGELNAQPPQPAPLPRPALPMKAADLAAVFAGAAVVAVTLAF